MPGIVLESQSINHDENGYPRLGEKSREATQYSKWSVRETPEQELQTWLGKMRSRPWKWVASWYCAGQALLDDVQADLIHHIPTNQVSSPESLPLLHICTLNAHWQQGIQVPPACDRTNSRVTIFSVSLEWPLNPVHKTLIGKENKCVSWKSCDLTPSFLPVDSKFKCNSCI